MNKRYPLFAKKTTYVLLWNFWNKQQFIFCIFDELPYLNNSTLNRIIKPYNNDSMEFWNFNCHGNNNKKLPGFYCYKFKSIVPVVMLVSIVKCSTFHYRIFSIWPYQISTVFSWNLAVNLGSFMKPNSIYLLHIHLHMTIEMINPSLQF